MTYKDVLENARTAMDPFCKVCKVCNGKACIGLQPGIGSAGSGYGFTGSVEFLSRVKLKMNTLYEYKGQDTSVSLFGETFKYPVFAAPIGGMAKNYGGKLTEGQYSDAVVKGTVAAGCAAFTGDGPNDKPFFDSLPPVDEVGGKAVLIFKPWHLSKMLERLKTAEEHKVMAVGMDIDAAGLLSGNANGEGIAPRSADDVKKITSSTKLPFILKGVLTPEAALKAADAGCYGIVVSNHGGRVLDDAMPPCEMLPEIRAAVGSRMKIFVDGGIRSGADVFKALALGADAVLIGRPYSISVFGGGIEGVKLYTDKIGGELAKVMTMTGCSSLKDITMDKIVIK